MRDGQQQQEEKPPAHLELIIFWQTEQIAALHLKQVLNGGLAYANHGASASGDETRAGESTGASSEINNLFRSAPCSRWLSAQRSAAAAGAGIAPHDVDTVLWKLVGLPLQCWQALSASFMHRFIDKHGRLGSLGRQVCNQRRKAPSTTAPHATPLLFVKLPPSDVEVVIRVLIAVQLRPRVPHVQDAPQLLLLLLLLRRRLAGMLLASRGCSRRWPRGACRRAGP